MPFLRHLTGYAPAKLASALASFGGVYVFTRLLGAEDYGRYALLISILALIHTLTLTWVEAANYRFAARAREQGTLADHYALALAMMRRSLLAGLAVLGLVWIALSHVPGYAAALPWIAVLMVTNTFVQMALEAHRAGHRVARYSVTETFRVLGGFAAGAALAWAFDLGAAAPLIGMAAAALVVAVREAVFLHKSARGGRLDKETSRAWMGYGFPIAAALLLDIILSASDRFLIAAFLGEASVGAYAAGYGVADKTVLMLCAWPALAASPQIMAAFERHGVAGAREGAHKLIRTLLLLGIPAATGLALTAQPLGEAMIGEAVRAQAIQIIPWIAFAGLLNGLMIHYASEAFQLAHRTRLRALLMLVPAGLNIALNLILLPTVGLMGAVYATLISYGVGLVLLALVGRRLVAFPWPVGEALGIALAAAAMAPAVWLLPDIGGWPQLFIEAGAGALTYVGVLLALNVVGIRHFVQEKLASTRALGA
ncbi:MAG: lipopolysaccharide biosynthesis protein [Hyphomonadaceae bacterium]|nr:lipopolysaccharide biosynthesis protein [Hyphomonadaceae bacterium]